MAPNTGLHDRRSDVFSAPVRLGCCGGGQDAAQQHGGAGAGDGVGEYVGVVEDLRFEGTWGAPVQGQPADADRADGEGEREPPAGFPRPGRIG
jgi:hypothetical protein